jgi:hypothetical protein
MNRMPWGAVICYMDEVVENNKPIEQRLQEKQQQEKEDTRMRIRAHEITTENKFTKNGELAIKIRKPCKWYCHDGIVGNEHPAQDGYEAGCHDFRRGKCPFYHPFESEWGSVISEYKPDQRSKVVKLLNTTTTTTNHRGKPNGNGYKKSPLGRRSNTYEEERY